jgi:hypothetical protein
MKKVRQSSISSQDAWGGRRKCQMSFNEEALYLEQYAKKAKKRDIVSNPILHSGYNKAVGKETSRSTFYRLLKRHKWIKVLPQHTNADPNARIYLKNPSANGTG